MTPEAQVHRHHGLLGTVVELRVEADSAAASAADRWAVAELERLQGLLSARDSASALRRWSAGTAASTPEIDEVVVLAEAWRARSGGAFDSAVGHLVALWSEAEAAGRLPTDAEVARARRTSRDDATRRRWCDLSALAKGWIVDRVAEGIAGRAGVAAVTVNAGGDLRHVGAGSVRVGVEDPRRPYDNAAPLTSLAVSGAAVATSGSTRRWWSIEGRRFAQLVDPRTGHPVDHVVSATVLAGDAATADAVATIVTVLGPGEGRAFVEGLEGVECLVVDAAGVSATSGWPDPPPP